MTRDHIHYKLGQWCHNNGIDSWSICTQDGNYKSMYIIIPIYQLQKFMKDNVFLNDYDDWWFNDTFEQGKVREGCIHFLFHNQCRNKSRPPSDVFYDIINGYEKEPKGKGCSISTVQGKMKERT